MLTLLLAATALAQWQDPSPHQVHMIPVEEGVKLEVLEWKGGQQPVVLLTGSGNTAHIYDEFAPKLADCCRVYAITRRGFGNSSHPQDGYTNQRLSEDVFQVIEQLEIKSPIVAGHSMAGGELCGLGNAHSNRIAGLVYMEAGANPVDFPWSNPEFRAVVGKLPSGGGPPRRTAADNASPQAYRAYQIRSGEFAFPEGEIRNGYEINADGSVGRYRTPQSVRDAIDKGAVARDYSRIKVPIVSIFALSKPPVADPKDTDEQRAARQKFYEMERAYIGRYVDLVRQANVETRILEWTGAKHYVFQSNEADVLHELKEFVARLK